MQWRYGYRLELARNAYYGLQLLETKNVTIKDCLIEGNDRSGVMLEYLYWGVKNVTLLNNTIWYNGGFGIESYASKNITSKNNILQGNGREKSQQKMVAEKKMVME